MRIKCRIFFAFTFFISRLLVLIFYFCFLNFEFSYSILHLTSNSRFSFSPVIPNSIGNPVFEIFPFNYLPLRTVCCLLKMEALRQPDPSGLTTFLSSIKHFLSLVFPLTFHLLKFVVRLWVNSASFLIFYC